MRNENNISKEQLISKDPCNHRIIMPLHIPHEEGYYSEAFQIFEMSLISLKKTTIYSCKISVISDACCETVNVRLHKLFVENEIDELILESQNVGKINSILKVLRTVNENFVTITDSDVLFLNNWDKEVFTIFRKFPKAAVVSPTPIFRNHMNYTANIWIDNLFSKRLMFRDVKNPKAMERFAQSLGWNSLENRFKDLIVTIKSRDNSTLAVVGATHFVATYNTKYLKNISKENTMFKLGGTSEIYYLDRPPFEADGYRLTTYDNFAYHIGNQLEIWINEVFNSLQDIQVKQDLKLPTLKKYSKNLLKKISEKLFLRLIAFRFIYNYILKNKGLNNEKLKSFWY